MKKRRYAQSSRNDRSPRQTCHNLVFEGLEPRRLLAFNPTGAEQEFLQLVNRIRTQPAGEFDRLFSSVSPLVARDSNVTNAVQFFSVSGTQLRTELNALPPVHPLAWNEAAYNYSQLHNQAMINSSPPNQFHSDTLRRRQALLDAGVNLRFANGEKINAENVYGAAESAMHLFASYIVDWGTGPGGMQPNRGHRAAITNKDFEQVGHRITSFSGGALGPLVNTQVLLNIENPPIMAVGAVFEDRNDSGWYEAGEGIGGTQITFDGPSGTFRTTAMAAGGYQIELPAGTYRATATGGGMAHPTVLESVTVGSTNTWVNFVYDPTAIPPDRLEPNNTRGTAVGLDGKLQTVNGLSIHTASDRDYFKLTPTGTGNATISIQFSHAAGNLDLALLNSSGTVIASSTSTTNNEQLTIALTRDTTYYIEVRSAGNTTNGSYSLTVNPPQAAPPVAINDRANANNASRSATINVLANDDDPDGPNNRLTAKLSPGAPSAFSMSGNNVQYNAPAGYSGVHRASYTATDDQGLTATGQIAVFVVDFTLATPWRNKAINTDIDGDGLTIPADVLLVVNDLNAKQSRRLPTGPAGSENLFGFLDSNGDGFVSPIDVLLVVNLINSRSGGEAEGLPQDVLATDPERQDEAIMQLYAFEHDDELRRKRMLG